MPDTTCRCGDQAVTQEDQAMSMGPRSASVKIHVLTVMKCNVQRCVAPPVLGSPHAGAGQTLRHLYHAMRRQERTRGTPS
eukprot:3218529-Amphidinium_carterae.2